MLNFSPSYVSSSSTLACLTCLVCALSASLRSEVHGHTNMTHCQEETSNKTIATPHSLNLTFSLFQSPKSDVIHRPQKLFVPVGFALSHFQKWFYIINLAWLLTIKNLEFHWALWGGGCLYVLIWTTAVTQYGASQRKRRLHPITLLLGWGQTMIHILQI